MDESSSSVYNEVLLGFLDEINILVLRQISYMYLKITKEC